jgi:hypothetical protein
MTAQSSGMGDKPVNHHKASTGYINHKRDKQRCVGVNLG